MSGALVPSFAAVLTPSGRGAVAVIGIRGPLAEGALERHFRRPGSVDSEAKSNSVRGANDEFLSPSLTLRATKNNDGWLGSNEVSPQRNEPGASLRSDPSHPSVGWSPLGRILYGTWRSSGEASDAREDVVLTRFETHWELGCHGGAIASAAILRDLHAAGIETISWQDWLARTKPNRLQTIAAVALAAAQSPAAALALLRAAELTEAALREICAILDDESGGSLRSTPATQGLLDKIAALLDTARWAKHLVSPWHIVLAGLPNAGKSSLLNALVGYERAIVFAQPGTTRDVVTAAAAYDGWRWELRDTAGLRATDDPLEAAGIERTDAMLAASDVTVLVIDGTRPWSESETLRRAHPRAICVRNKSDLWTGNVAWEGEAPAEPSSRENSIQQKDAKIAKEIAARRVSEGDERQFSTEGSKGNEEGIAGGNNPWDAKAHSEPLKNPIPLTPALSRIQSNDMVAPLSGEGENAAPLAVSATTGAGLEELRAAIHARLNLPVWNEIGACVWDAALAHDLRTLQHVLTNDPAALPAALRELRTWIE